LVGSIFHMTRKIVSEMTYNVSMGTLNPTIPYLPDLCKEDNYEMVASVCPSVHSSVVCLKHNSRTERHRKPIIRRMEAHHTGNP